ncbi:MAG: PAS domain-containing protein, partial [Desulfuromonadales bacterium]|nr:PAS domain-containing protein [Desulfuromonadales bacterium]
DAETTPLRSDQLEQVNQVLMTQQPQFAPLRHSEQGLLLEVFLPIFPPEASGLEPAPVAVLLLSKVIGERLKGMFSSRLLDPGERTRLLQRVADGYQEIVPWLPGQLQTIKTSVKFQDQKALPFAARASLTGESKVYSFGVSAIGPNWWVIVEADYAIAREDLRGQQKAMMSIAALLVLVFAVGFGALWATLLGQQEHKLAAHFEQLANEIEQQRQFLDSINNTIADYIVLKDTQGHYLYVNPAFAQATGRAPEELIGLDNEAVFGFDTARRLEHSDHQVQTGGQAVTLNETVYLQSQLHHLQIAKTPLKDANGAITGIVSVSRDVTELIEVQKRQEQATAKTVEALVRAIELTDPYLAGHSQLMGAVGVELAKALNASDTVKATIETAANLSQIGKLFVDRELLFKSGSLSADEKREMEAHVDHAAKVLQDIDFGLPVFDAIYQMNETLDGAGYPQGLKGDSICPPAQILAVANNFCAMVEPRAYRGARTVEETLQIMESAAECHDRKILAALREVVTSANGEKLLAQRHQS